jgi:hypothetical protein
MGSFLLTVLLLLSCTYLYPQTTKTIKDVSPDGKHVVVYSSARPTNSKAEEISNVPFGTQPDWQATIERQIGGLAWADYDLDGDLDLAVGCYHSDSYPPINDFENEIYRNDNGVLTTLPAWSSADMKSTTDIKWADINGDGYPDLLAANGDQSLVASVIYMNSASGLDTNPSWFSSDNDWTVGAAFGDINGDGYIDLAFGNQGNTSVPQRPICVFYNDNGTLHTNPDYLSDDEMITNTVALGDVNNSDLTEKTESFTGNGTGSVYMLSMIPVYKVDSVLVNNNLVTNFTDDNINGWVSLGSTPSSGDQIVIKYRYMKEADLAACKWSGYSSGVYFNNGGYLNGLPGWAVSNTSAQKGIAWADYDNDGYLDLAIGGNGTPAVLYKNNGGTLGTLPVWQSGSSSTSTQDLVWADVNNDGYPDLAVVHFGYSRVEIFMNNAGILETTPGWTYTTGSPATAVAFGDLNGDGYPDLTVGTARSPVVVFLNTTVVPVELKSFRAKNTSDGVLLDWITATETNNKGFEIERSRTSNVKGQMNWEKIGYVAGFGTTTEPKSYSFTDNNVTSGAYSYRLKQIDLDGSYEYSNIVEVQVNVPLQFSLSQNYPNPFNPTTQIKYSIPEDGFVSLKVYNALGQQVAELVNGIVKAGSHSVSFNAGSAAGVLSSGIYYYRMESGSRVMVKKMMLLK